MGVLDMRVKEPTDEELRKTEVLLPCSETRRREHQARRDNEFIFRIPMGWLQRASKASGRIPIFVGLAIWFQAGLRSRRSDLKITRTTLQRFGVSPKGLQRGLKRLESMGLITCDRGPGRSARVSILEPWTEETTSQIEEQIVQR